MSDQFWPPSEAHPPSGVLLLYMEGELDGREAALVRQHLADCWDCRVRCEDMEKGIHDYVVARRDVLIPHLPPPPAGRHNFIRRLYAEAARIPEPSLFGRLMIPLRQALIAPPRAAWLTGAVSLVMALAAFYTYVANPPRMTAAAFFERVRQTSGAGALPKRYVAVQRVQLRQGTRTIERRVVRGDLRQAKLRHPGQSSAAMDSAIDPVWVRQLTAAQIDWDDPLSADRFERWHDSQGGVRDSVTRSKETVTLTAKPTMGEPVLLASFTVRAADWHPIAERFEFSNQPALEITEVSYEVRKEVDAETAKSAEGLRPALRLALPPPSGEPSVAEPSDADLDRSEIAVREALHRLDADRNEVPEIVRQDHLLVIKATAETAERQEQLVTAVEAVPYVKAEIANAANAAAVDATRTPSPAGSPPPSYSTTPPLAKALWDYKGGMDVANNYLDMVRASYFHALADANALHRLAQRYSEKDWNQLTPDVQVRVNLLAADYIRAMQKNAPEYLRQLSGPLDEMLRQNTMSSPPASVSANPGCQPWQSLAPRIVAGLQQTQTSFRRLFIVDQTDTPLTLSADSLLAEVVQLRTRVSQEITTLCLP